MSLLDIAKSIKKEGFDPRKDSANGPAPIPAGTYPVVLKKATFNVSDKGWESLGYQFEIRGGDYSGRSEFATFGTLTEWNGKNLDWAVERTMKFFIKALEEALKRKAVGSYYNLVISVTKGKDGREFRNYDLEEEEAQPLTEADIDDDDLPF
ncbi:Uncharacterised protein [Streptococcus pneumoniae]|nr:Uncharacterised protein [Streptococcus pneumoniae]VPL27312.1 Uncharacterised protein [Streptococcus pneumoniae]VPV92969.1 Uncharacterised protein [Streptococcus pneumoniae]